MIDNNTVIIATKRDREDLIRETELYTRPKAPKGLKTVLCVLAAAVAAAALAVICQLAEWL